MSLLHNRWLVPMSLPKSKRNFHMLSSILSSPQPRVHILGLGSIGTFIAHGLLETPKSPAVTLLLHRESLYDSYRNNGNKIILKTQDGRLLENRGYDTEVYRADSWYRLPALEETTDLIDHLIVSVKATRTTTALHALKGRLSAKSTILFLQNGCGMIDAVNQSIFPDPRTRPNYIVGVISHGVTLNSPFHVTHTGAAAISLGVAPPDFGVAPSSEQEYLLSLFPQSTLLNATAYPYAEVFQIQLEKLAVNAFCNPLCALHNAQNGFLFTLPEIRRQILTEVSNVVMMLPELRHIRGVQDRFAVDRLEKTVIDILTKTAETTCSMVWDLRAGRETEIRFINGYWVRRGKEVGVPTPVNERLMEEVISKGG